MNEMEMSFCKPGQASNYVLSWLSCKTSCSALIALLSAQQDYQASLPAEGLILLSCAKIKHETNLNTICPT